MLRDNLAGLIAPMRNSVEADPSALGIQNQKQASDDRSSCLENPRPVGAESSLTENVTSPFQAEPAQNDILAYWQQGYPGAWDSEVYTKEPDGSVTFMGVQAGEDPSGPTETLIPKEESITKYVTSGHGAPILPSNADQQKVLAGQQITYYGSEDSYIVNGAQTYGCLAASNAVRLNNFHCPPGKTCVLSEDWKALFHAATLDTPAYRGRVIASDLYEINMDRVSETHYFAPNLGLVQIDGFDDFGNLKIRVVRER